MRPRTFRPRKCLLEGCGKTFQPNGPRQKFCCEDHKRKNRTAKEAEEADRSARDQLAREAHKDRHPNPSPPLRRMSSAERRAEFRGELLEIRAAEESVAARAADRANCQPTLSSEGHDESEARYQKEQAADYTTIRTSKAQIANLLRGCSIRATTAKWLGLGDFPMALIDHGPTQEEGEFSWEVAEVAGFPPLERRSDKPREVLLGSQPVRSWRTRRTETGARKSPGGKPQGNGSRALAAPPRAAPIEDARAGMLTPAWEAPAAPGFQVRWEGAGLLKLGLSPPVDLEPARLPAAEARFEMAAAA